MTPAGSIEPRARRSSSGWTAPSTICRRSGIPPSPRRAALKLSDIADVKRGYEDPATFLIRNNGEPTLLLGVVMREAWNGLDLGRRWTRKRRRSTRRCRWA